MPNDGRDRHRLPAGFDVDRAKSPGRYPLLDVFRGLTEIPPFARYPGSREENVEVAQTSWAMVSDGPGYIYVAPREVPVEIQRAGFNMHTSDDEEIVVSHEYLRGGAALDLYLDVIHEFLHILQRKQGRELWPGLTVSYVDRPTEIEAYAFSVSEARRLGISDDYLREYLRVFWVTKSEHHRLLRHLGLEIPRQRRVRRASQAIPKRKTTGTTRGPRGRNSHRRRLRTTRR